MRCGRPYGVGTMIGVGYCILTVTGNGSASGLSGRTSPKTMRTAAGMPTQMSNRRHRRRSFLTGGLSGGGAGRGRAVIRLGSKVGVACSRLRAQRSDLQFALPTLPCTRGSTFEMGGTPHLVERAALREYSSAASLMQVRDAFWRRCVAVHGAPVEIAVAAGHMNRIGERLARRSRMALGSRVSRCSCAAGSASIRRSATSEAGLASSAPVGGW